MKAMACCLALSLAACAARADGNLLVNPGFGAGARGWTLESHQPADSSFLATNGVLSIRRAKADYFLRAFQDVPVEAGAEYRLTFRMRTRGEGFGQSFVILGGDAGRRWFEYRTAYGPRATTAEWRDVAIVVRTFAGVSLVRVNFGAQGKATEVEVRDVQLVQTAPARPAVDVPRAAAPPPLDGRFDAPAWQTAPRLAGFRLLGAPERPADAPTEVRLLVHGDDLYIGVRADEPHMDRLRIRPKELETGVWADDCIEVYLTVPGQGNDFAHFIVNPKGEHEVMVTGALAEQETVRWYSRAAEFPRGEWDAAASRDAEGWGATVRIALPTLFRNFPKADPLLFANFCRHRPHAEQPYSNWAAMRGETFQDTEQFRDIRLDWRVRARSAANVALNCFNSRLTPPETLLAGDPVRRVAGRGAFRLPRRLDFSTNGLAIATDVLALIERGVAAGGDGPASRPVRCTLWTDGDLPHGGTDEERRLLAGPEAFRLEIRRRSVEIAGRSREGVLRGLATFALISSWARNSGREALPCETIYDAPRLPVRGWMAVLDKEQIDLLFLLRYNTLMFGLDGYGALTPFPFDSHPNIGNTNGMTKAQYRELADYARARGINPIPMFGGWCRASYIYNKPEYRHLAENPNLMVGSLSKASHDKNGCGSNPATWALLKDLFTEVVDTFAPTDLHMVMDEAFYDDIATCPRCKAAGFKPSDFLVNAVTNVHALLAARGVRTWIWADNFDPEQNGGHFDISGPAILAKLPKDVVMNDWKYRGTTYSSVKLFTGAGFPTVVSSWQTPWNVADIIAAAADNSARGFVGTSWNDTDARRIPPELICNLSLGAYLSWSPGAANLRAFPFVPAALYQTAAYGYGRRCPPAGAVAALPPPPGALSGGKLAAALGLPPGGLGFLDTPGVSPRGVTLSTFHRDGAPAGLVVPGGSTNPVALPLPAGRIRCLTLLHTVNRQPVQDHMHNLIAKFKDATAGRYVLRYADGSSATNVTLRFRREITSWNDRQAPAETLPALFGTVNDSLHVNICCLTLENPHPDRELRALEIVPGNRPGLDLVLLGVAVEP